MAFDPVTAAFDLGSKFLDKFFPDPAQRAEQQIKLVEMQQNGELAILAAETELAKGQQAINQEEAKSSRLFIAGWRPFIGWVCGVALAYHYILQPFIVFVYVLNGHAVPPLPELAMSDLLTILLGLLGLGGLRTVEKLKGVSK